MALWSIAFLGTRPIAALLDGGLASLVGPHVATIVMALPTAGAALLALQVKSRDHAPSSRASRSRTAGKSGFCSSTSTPGSMVRLCIRSIAFLIV